MPRPDEKKKLEALLQHLRAHREQLAIAMAKGHENMSPDDVCRPLAEAQGAIKAVEGVLNKVR